ncbi:hypothetical protein NDU88_005062 [Pleurodeles waltl]|uniref:Uncharacterized protein n=1 Tax=Pleurodeles waltl TaxID=8319 RepID=A0AAV7PHT2_PLEWA|nr:hypothetical protein NDU88_005062 [Pleurodeles waltl]
MARRGLHTSRVGCLGNRLLWSGSPLDGGGGARCAQKCLTLHAGRTLGAVDAGGPHSRPREALDSASRERKGNSGLRSEEEPLPRVIRRPGFEHADNWGPVKP